MDETSHDASRPPVVLGTAGAARVDGGVPAIMGVEGGGPEARFWTFRA